MKGIIQTMLEEIYTKATEIAHGFGKSSQVQSIHDEKSENDGNYYITLRQLEEIINGYLD